MKSDGARRSGGTLAGTTGEGNMKTRLCPLFIVVVIVQLIMSQYCYGQSSSESNVPKGMIKGKVIDTESKTPLRGVNILVIDTQFSTTTDSTGDFAIDSIPVGNYVLRFSRDGYETFSKTDIIVKPGRITFIQAELRLAAIEMGEITVTAGYFPQTSEQPTSAVNFSSEEIRRAAGSGGDVSRIISGLPSIAKTNDTESNLIVRGGSPVENGFLIDNIEIPNINHFPTQGSSGGPIGMVNVDFIQDVNFYTGGFSAAYGDKLSSIMDLTFREGNRDEIDGQLEMSFAGFAVVAEGPVPNERGAWLFSARRSFLDLIVEAMMEGEVAVPKYSDYQGKLVYDVTPDNKITVLDVLGVDSIEDTREDAEDAGDIAYGKYNASKNTFGVNWQYLWSQSGYSNTAISHTFTKYKINQIETKTDTNLLDNNSLEQAFRLRNTNHYRFSESNRVEFGVNAEHTITDHDYFFAVYTDVLGGDTPEFSIDDRISADKIGVYASHIWRPFHRLTTTLGVRADYFSYNENIHISPRLSASYSISDKTSINGSTGVFYQELPLVVLYQNEENKELETPVAYHYVLGLKHLLTENTQLTLEAYDKEYKNFPLDPATPPLFVLDELTYRYGFFFNHEELVDNGKARSRGVELLIQKKLARDFYGIISSSYSRVKYQDYDGIWRDRVFDNRYNFSISGGYKPNNVWEFSMRWIYAGGPPYTPFDMEASTAMNRGVIDESNINGDRYPDYHSLNVRLDRRFHFSRSNLLFYLSVWNVYNRENISAYYWNEIENKPDKFNQWSLMPVFGLEYEF